MPLFNASVMIKELRKAQGFSQKKLAEGICARETITRLEKGTHKPDWHVMKNIFIRLGLNPDDYSGIASDYDSYYLKESIKSDELIRTLDLHGLKAKIEELEANMNRQSADVNYSLSRLLLRMKANLHAQGDYKDSALSLKYLMEYIRQVRPDFDIAGIPDYFLSADECASIRLLAVLYKDLYGMTEALDIWWKLKENYERNYHIDVNADADYRNLLFNISLAMKHSGRFEECLEMAVKGLELSKAYRDMRTYAAYLHQQAWCLMKLDRRREGEEVFKKAIMLAYVLDGWAQINYQTVKQEYKDNFGGEPDLSLPW